MSTKFKKGVSGNPSGRPKADPKVTQFQKMTYNEFIDHLQKYGAMTQAEMVIHLDRDDCTMFEKIFGRLIYQAAKGDKAARAVLFERLWGKVKDSIEITRIEPFIIQRPSGAEVELGAITKSKKT